MRDPSLKRVAGHSYLGSTNVIGNIGQFIGGIVLSPFIFVAVWINGLASPILLPVYWILQKRKNN